MTISIGGKLAIASAMFDGFQLNASASQMLVLIPFATKPFTPDPVYNEANAAILLQNLDRNDSNQREGDALDVYLSRLAWTYECTGDCFKAQRNHQPYKRIDSNQAYSYGCLQFQQATYLAFAKKHKIDPWAGNGIYDCNNQWKIARAMNSLFFFPSYLKKFACN